MNPDQNIYLSEEIDFQPSMHRTQDNPTFSDAIGIFRSYYHDLEYNTNVEDSDIAYEEATKTAIRKTVFSIKELENDNDIKLTDNQKTNVLKMRLLAVPSKEGESKQLKKRKQFFLVSTRRERRSTTRKKANDKASLFSYYFCDWQVAV